MAGIGNLFGKGSKRKLTREDFDAAAKAIWESGDPMSGSRAPSPWDRENISADFGEFSIARNPSESEIESMRAEASRLRASLDEAMSVQDFRAVEHFRNRIAELDHRVALMSRRPSRRPRFRDSEVIPFPRHLLTAENFNEIVGRDRFSNISQITADVMNELVDAVEETLRQGLDSENDLFQEVVAWLRAENVLNERPNETLNQITDLRDRIAQLSADDVPMFQLLQQNMRRGRTSNKPIKTKDFADLPEIALPKHLLKGAVKLEKDEIDQVVKDHVQKIRGKKDGR